MHEPHGLYSSVGCQQRSRRGQLLSWCFLSWSRMMKSHHGCTQAPPGDAAVRLQLAEREQALLLAQETIQVSPPLSPQPSAVPMAARRDRLPLPLQPSCDATAQRGVCSVLSTSWAAAVSVPGAGGTLKHGPAWQWLCCRPAGQHLARVFLWLLQGSAGLLGTVLGLKDKGLVKLGSDSSAWPGDVVQFL